MTSTAGLIAVLLAAIALIVFLIVKLRFHGSIALVLAALAVALVTGVPLGEVVGVIEEGVGGTLGFLVLIIGFGAVLGKMLEVSGGAERLALSLLDAFGARRATVAMALLGLIAGIPVFVEVGFVLLVPLVFVVARAAGISRVAVGLPLAISLMTVHCVLPPHPAATAIAGTLGADVGTVIVLGLIVALPAALAGGPLYARLVPGAFAVEEDAEDSEDSGDSGATAETGGTGATAGGVATLPATRRDTTSALPGFGVTLLTVLLPLLIMVAKTVIHLIVDPESTAGLVVGFIGNPIVALLISVLFAYYSLGLSRGRSLSDISGITDSSFAPIGGVLLIIGAGGGFNAVLTASGIAPALADALAVLPISPIIMAWLIAIILHFAVGSATVAMISAAGIVAPLMATTGVSPEIMTLAIGAGAIGLTQVTDSLFWMYQSYMKISVQQSIRTLTVGTTVTSVVALGMVLLLSLFF
ncbi:GntT/GntP/DsdX family permease [Corynebacterium guangdongense]|uniref:Gluconate transporter n=1 Tax=Corynebacterium guangdongense TaxID=1783348 RepID=A0ABU1ZWA0_9CORY|nr:gluconate:H+ symporter [Corynebacterium guangdongense]MDR7329191.1 gluconate transporter [Corynebacterium guangdongense]WJZ17757.1 DsdX permease [Corynebacterium guangdongense]